MSKTMLSKEGKTYDVNSSDFLIDIISLTFAGFMIGQSGSGILSDKFGRRPLILMSGITIPILLLVTGYFNEFFASYIIARIGITILTGYSAVRLVWFLENPALINF